MKSFLTLLLCIATLGAPALASASTSTVTRSDGYTVSITGSSTGAVGMPSTYTAVCGMKDQTGPCPYGEFRMYGGTINRLGEGFGRGATGTYTFRAFGWYQVRYRVGAGCIGSPRTACPIDVFLTTVV